MDITELDRAIELHDKIEMLREIQDGLNKEPSLFNVMMQKFDHWREVLPEDALKEASEATSKFNTEWEFHISRLITRLEEELKAL